MRARTSSARSRGGATSGSRLRGWFIGDEPDFRARGIWLLLAFAAMAGVLLVHLVDVQIRQGPSLRAKATAAHQSEVNLPAHRGLILDRSGRQLAGDVTVFDVFADPGLISPSDRHDVALRVAPVLGLGPGKVEQLLATPGRFVYLAKQVDDKTKAKLQALGIAGIGTLDNQQRVYSSSAVAGTSFASSLLGFVDPAGNGQYGLEQYYNALLRGQDGSESTLRDVQGNAIVLSQQDRKDPRDGRNLQLGLDSQIQYWAEQALAKGVVDSQSESGSLLIMDTHTGAIRAWADYPSYDASNYATAPLSMLKDQAVSGLYEPGSVMKVVTFAGGLNNKAITPQTEIDEGPIRIDGYTIGDWDGRAHGRVNMQWVLDDSLNDGAIRVMQMEGQHSFYENLAAFGIGAPTGVDVAGENNQPLAPEQQWKGVDFATTAFGQHVQVTPLQMLAAINAVGNNGVWVQPHVVDKIVDPATGQATPFSPTTRRVMSADSAATLQKMMTGVVEDHGASGYAAKIPAFKGQIAGKTGTASVPVNGVYGGDVIVSFTGFMPVSNPQFTMLVVLRLPKETKVAREGAYLAAPIWHDMAQLLVDQWKIVP
ncbi:MAG TPA: penicillin-binding protein 2 [Candidatus Angelobacter sp.]|jgi:cell division protein FtsI/penicillin-binding protein 2|nr:penicillin-binding protein 2 [Candidatus Angelobacter sp.]